MNNDVKKFKEVMHKGMLEAFKQDGAVVPILYYYQNGEPVISEIPPNLLGNSMGKDVLSGIITKICQQPSTLCAGIIIEAYGLKLNLDDDKEDAEKLKRGELRISEHPKRVDIVLMVWSTPQENEMIAYEVDIENKSIGDRFSDEEAEGVGGRFLDFFGWMKN